MRYQTKPWLISSWRAKKNWWGGGKTLSEAPARAKGAALGIYNTTQALGLFVGGALGGWLVQHFDAAAVFMCDVLMVLVWLVAALTMPPLPARRNAASGTASATPSASSGHGILETKS